MTGVKHLGHEARGKIRYQLSIQTKEKHKCVARTPMFSLQKKNTNVSLGIQPMGDSDADYYWQNINFYGEGEE